MRTAEAVVAVAIFAFGAVVIFDSVRLGARWGDDGPQSGYFPFYIGLAVCIASMVNFFQGVLRPRGEPGAVFVTAAQVRPVLSVLIPAVVYVGAIQLIGIYVASIVYIALFMVVLGKYSWGKACAVALGVGVAVFCLFEVWFKVPLHKGYWNPLEFLGY